MSRKSIKSIAVALMIALGVVSAAALSLLLNLFSGHQAFTDFLKDQSWYTPQNLVCFILIGIVAMIALGNLCTGA
jgi:hypothetical protein